MNRVKYTFSFLLFQFSLLQALTMISPVKAETKSDRSNLTAANSAQDISPPHQVSTSAQDLMAQGNATRVTGIEVNQTESGLELILETSTGSERLVPLILSDGKDLVIDILDATLAFELRNGVTKLNPSPGITKVTVNKADENSIQVRITGDNQTPSAEVVTGRDNLVLSVIPEETTTAQDADEEIEIIATGQAEEGSDYFIPDAGIGRTDTPIIDTPGTVQVIPRQVFEDQGAIEQRDAISRNAVGVVTGNSARSGFNDVLIRGFEESTLINGIPETFFFASVGRDLSNVERLEVLSGPASIISGNVEPGGAVNIVTKQPLLEPFYEFTASYGSFNTVEGAIDISGPLNKSKTVAYRLNASIDYSETFFDPDEVEIERFTIAPVISWQIGSQTKLTFEGLFRNSQTPQRVGIPALGTVLDNPNGEIPRDQFVGEPSFDTNTSIVGQISYDLEHDFNDNWSLRHTFRYSNFQNEQIEAFANELLDDLRTLDRTGLSAEDDIDNYQLTTYVNGKFKTGPVNHELLVGVDAVLERDVFTSEFFEIENIDIFEPEFAGGVGETTFVGTFLDSNDGVGIYLQDQIKFFDDRLIVLLGGRVDFIGADSVDDSEGTESSFNQDAFSPTAGILYKVTDNVSVYGSFSRSFEGVDGISATGEVFEASDGEQFEVGAKASWLNNRLFTTLALYDLTFSNLTTPDPENDGFDIQTGEQKSQGIELQTKGEILPGWNITASYAFTDTEVTEDTFFEVGNSFANIPENAVNLWTTYTIAEGSLSGLGFGLGLFYVGEREGDLENSFTLDDYLRTDAAIYYRGEKLDLALNLRNLFDEEFIEFSEDELEVSPADPLTFLFTASYKF